MIYTNLFYDLYEKGDGQLQFYTSKASPVMPNKRIYMLI